MIVTVPQQSLRRILNRLRIILVANARHRLRVWSVRNFHSNSTMSTFIDVLYSCELLILHIKEDSLENIYLCETHANISPTGMKRSR